MEQQQTDASVHPDTPLGDEDCSEAEKEAVCPEHQQPTAETYLANRLRQMVRLDDETYWDTTRITNAEYQLFLDETQSEEEDFRPAHWEDETCEFGQEHQPVVGVQPSAAERFCQWLTDRDPEKPWSYRLPKAGEWVPEQSSSASSSEEEADCWAYAGDGRIVYEGPLPSKGWLPSGVEGRPIRLDAQALDSAIAQAHAGALEHAHALPLIRAIALSRMLALARMFALARTHALTPDREHALSSALGRARILVGALTRARTRAVVSAPIRTRALTNARDCARALVSALVSARGRTRALALTRPFGSAVALARALASTLDSARIPHFVSALQLFQEHLFAEEAEPVGQNAALFALTFFLTEMFLEVEEQLQQGGPSSPDLTSFMKAPWFFIRPILFPQGDLLSKEALSQQKAGVQRTVNLSFDLCYDFVLLNERRKGNWPAFEGIRIVRERQTDQKSPLV